MDTAARIEGGEDEHQASSVVNAGPSEVESSILVVCTGNLNRSPLAAALLRRQLGDHVHVASAGLACGGVASPSPMVRAARRLGVDLSKHRSIQVTPDALAAATLVLCMDRSHPVELAELSPAACSNSFLLTEAEARFADIEHDSLPEVVSEAASRRSAQDFVSPPYPAVDDPMGRRRRQYRRMADEVSQLVTDLVQVVPESLRRPEVDAPVD